MGNPYGVRPIIGVKLSMKECVPILSKEKKFTLIHLKKNVIAYLKVPDPLSGTLLNWVGGRCLGPILTVRGSSFLSFILFEAGNWAPSFA